MWLIKNGVPFDVAFSIDDVTRGAWCIVYSEIESGEKFNFNTMRFDD